MKNWLDDPLTSTPLSSVALEDMETRLSAYTDSVMQSTGTYAAFGAASTVADSTTSRLFVKTSTSSDAENGITFKRPNATWGVGQAYGYGQVFQLLKDSVSATDIGYAGITPNDYILARMDRDGGWGIQGMHVATGLRQAAGFTSTYAIGITPYIDTMQIYLKTVAGATQPFIGGYDSAIVEKFRINTAGTGVFGQGSGAHAGDGMAVGDIGSGASGYFGLGHSDRMNSTGYALQQGASGDTYLNAAGTQTVNFRIANRALFAMAQTSDAANSVTNPTQYNFSLGYHQMGEINDPAAPGVNAARLYVRDNGAGKSQLCVVFNTGAVQVLATQP